MSAKQDRQGVRSAADLERKYKFGESFAEAMGLAEEAKKAAYEAKDLVGNLDKNLTQDEIFKRLTKDGTVQGLYRDENGDIYINASYLATGILTSKDGKTFYLDLDNGVLRMTADEFKVSGKTVDEIAQSAVNDYAEIVTQSIDNLQAQIDGQVQSWFYDYVPTTSNYPASSWTTETEKINHLGDLFYIVGSDGSNGQTYRWALVNDNYTWVIVEDSDVSKALAQAAKAQDTADGKRRVFVVQPAPPYDEGDLWTDGADLRVCQNSRTSGGYVSSDWKLATDYIDSTKAGEIATDKATEKVNAQTQQDIFNKLTNNGASQGVYMENGQLYINASYLKSGIIRAELIDGTKLNILGGSSIAGWNIDNNSIYKTSGSWDKGTFMCTGSSYPYKIGGSPSLTGWVFGAGGKFGVTKDGAVYANNLNVNGGNIKVKSSGRYSDGCFIANADGIGVTTDDYVEGESGDALLLSPYHIQITRDGGGGIVLIDTSYDEYGNIQKVLSGNWTVDGSIKSPTITALERRIAYLESLLGISDD